MRTQLRPKIDIQNKVDQLLNCKNILILGPKNSGKTSIALNYAIREFTLSKNCFFTTEKKERVIEKAIELFPDLAPEIKSNFLIYQAPNAFNGQFAAVDDKILSDILLGIIQVIEKNNPDRIVFDEITTFLSFSNLEILRNVFQKLLIVLERKKIKALFTVSEPVSQRSIKIVSILKNEFAYYLNLKTNPIFNT